MRKPSRIATFFAAGAVVVAFAAASAFADSRHREETRRNDSHDSWRSEQRSGEFRENERVTLEGTIASLEHDTHRNGYRVRLDKRHEAFWVPAARIHQHLSYFRPGISVRLGGIFRGGFIDVDLVSWRDRDGRYSGRYYDDRDDRRYRHRDDRGRDGDSLRGEIERIDYRREVLAIRDRRTGRIVTVDVRRADRRSRIDLEDLRRGDQIRLSGDWRRDGSFRADEIESLRTDRRGRR